jgi:hypothetical protein
MTKLPVKALRPIFGSQLAWRSGLYYTQQGLDSTGDLPNARLGLCPLFVPSAVTITAVALEVTAAAAPLGATLHPAIYADDAGWPGALLLDAGPVAADSTGVKEVAGLALAVDAGTWLWVGALALGATTTAPTVRRIAETTPGIPTTSAATALVNRISGAQQNALTALPATFGADRGASSITTPKVALRTA